MNSWLLNVEVVVI